MKYYLSGLEKYLLFRRKNKTAEIERYEGAGIWKTMPSLAYDLDTNYSEPIARSLKEINAEQAKQTIRLIDKEQNI